MVNWVHILYEISRPSQSLFSIQAYTYRILTKSQPIIVLNFTGVGDPNHYNDVWTSFREAARPSMERTVGNLSMSDLSHSFDDSLLKGPPRVMNAGCVVTDLWPGMGEELWDSFVAYTAANPDVVESMVALEFHATRRQRPVRKAANRFPRLFRLWSPECIKAHSNDS